MTFEQQPSGPSARQKWAKTVHHGGRNYVATSEMAAIFEGHATEVISRGATELVPLLHREGVDLLLVGPANDFVIVNVEVGLSPFTRPIPIIDIPAS